MTATAAANLGCATTRELLDELDARFEIAGAGQPTSMRFSGARHYIACVRVTLEEPDLAYRTVNQ